MAYIIRYRDGIFAGTFIHQGEVFPYSASEARPPKKWKTLKGVMKAMDNLSLSQNIDDYDYKIEEVDDE